MMGDPFGQINRVANAACKECAVLVETGRDRVYFPNTGKVSALFDFSQDFMLFSRPHTHPTPVLGKQDFSDSWRLPVFING